MNLSLSKKSRTNRPYIFRNRDKETLLVFCTQEKLYMIFIIYYRYTQTGAAILVLLKKIINLFICLNKFNKLNKENL